MHLALGAAVHIPQMVSGFSCSSPRVGWMSILPLRSYCQSFRDWQCGEAGGKDSESLADVIMRPWWLL